MNNIGMATFTKNLQHSLAAASVFGAVMAAASPADAVAITNFTLEKIDPINTPLPSYVETPAGPLATQLTINNAAGTDLPAAGGISGNNTGICAYLQNSSGAGNRRCGFLGPTGATVDSSVTSIDLTFSRSVFLRSFEVAAFNNLTSATMTLGSTPFLITGTAVNPVAGNFLVSANTPITLQTSSAVFSSGQSGAIRISNIVVEDVPGPIPFLGVSAAFIYGRKLRKKVS
jgi:hypothetical protein